MALLTPRPAAGHPKHRKCGVLWALLLAEADLHVNHLSTVVRKHNPRQNICNVVHLRSSRTVSGSNIDGVRHPRPRTCKQRPKANNERSYIKIPLQLEGRVRGHTKP